MSDWKKRERWLKRHWSVCQGSYGVVVRRMDKGKPGGNIWNGFGSKREAIEAARLIAEGKCDRKPDDRFIELH